MAYPIHFSNVILRKSITIRKDSFEYSIINLRAFSLFQYWNDIKKEKKNTQVVTNMQQRYWNVKYRTGYYIFVESKQKIVISLFGNENAFKKNYILKTNSTLRFNTSWKISEHQENKNILPWR